MQKVNVTLLGTVRVILQLIQRLKRQEHYFDKQLPQVLKNLTIEEPPFSPNATRRLRKYWELALNVVCNSFYELSGHQLSDTEQYRILLLSIFGPLYDDLFDDQVLDAAQLEAFTLEPEKHVPVTLEEQIAKDAYLELLRISPDGERVISHLHAVFHWQQASLRQLSDDISEQDLYEITYKKSYYSFLLYYAVLDHYPDESVQPMLYQAAGLLQLTNDAFDVYKDIHSGVFTLPNLYRDFDKLQQNFLSSVAAFNETLDTLPFPAAARKQYSITMHTLHAMGYLALEQLKTHTRQAHNLDELRSLSRKTLVCDMDSLQQKIRCMIQVRNLANHRDTTPTAVVQPIFLFVKNTPVAQ